MLKSRFLALFAGTLLLASGCSGKDPEAGDDTGSVGTDDTGVEADDTGNQPTDDTGEAEDYSAWTLTLDGPETAAPNQTVSYGGTLTDGDGDDRTSDASLTLSFDGAEQEGFDVTPTASGDYSVELTASLADESWTESLTLSVAVGPAYAIDLVLDDTTAELGEGLGFTVTITDEWGNETEDTATISSDATSGWSVDGDELVFSEEGSYNFTATTGAKADVTDTEGPVTVDSNGPLITLEEPGRGAFVEGTSTTVSGTVEDPTSGVAAFTVGGTKVSVGKDGSFSTTVTLDEGLNTITLEAEDNDGNSSDFVFAALAGEYQDVDDTNDNGLLVRLNEDGLNAMAAPLADELDPADLETAVLAANPLAYEEVDAGFFTCSVTVDSTALDFTVDDPELDAVSGGLDLTLTLQDFDLDLDIVLECAGVETSASGEVTDTTTTVDASVEIEVVAPGDVEVTVTDVEASFTDLDIDLGSLESALGSYGLGAEDLLDAETLLGDELEAAVEDALPGALEDALEAVAIEETFEVEGSITALAAELGDLQIDEDGLTLTLPTDISTETLYGDLNEAPGYFVLGGEEPDYAASPGLMLSIELDTLSAIFHSAWAGGAFHLDLSEGDLGIDSSMIGLIFEGATSLDLSLDPQQPPVLLADKAGDLYLYMGELMVDFSGEVDGSYEQLGSATLHSAVPAEVALTAGGLLQLTFGTAESSVDVLVEDPYEVAEAETLQALLAVVASSFGGELFPDMSLPVPSLGDYSLEADDVYVDGDDDSWVTIEGDLE